METLELAQILAALFCGCASAEIAERMVLNDNPTGLVRGTIVSFPIGLAIFVGLGINNVALAVYIGLTAKLALTGLATISSISFSRGDKSLSEQELQRLIEWRESILIIVEEIERTSLNPKNENLRALIDECRGKVSMLDTRIWALRISIREEMV
jgi:hypothetical protein